MPDVVVRTERCTLRLDSVSGDLRGLTWHDPAITVIREPSLGENFRILLPLPQRESVYFNSREQVVSSIEGDQTGVTCVYESLRNDTEKVDVRVLYRMDCRGDGLEFSIDVDNRTDRPVAEVLFGMLGGFQGLGRRTDTRSLIPGAHVNLAPDILRWFPAGEYGGGNLGIRCSARGFLYPGYDGMSMSWASFYNPRNGVGLYYANHDPETRLAALYFELRPFTTSAVRGSNWPRRGELPDGEPIGLTTGWLNFPFTRRSSVHLGPVLLQVHHGDWRVGSTMYRKWFDTHFPIRKTSWLRREMAWQSTILLNPEGVTAHQFADLPAMAADSRKYDVTTFEICGWDVGGIDRSYPDYRPDPVLGSREDFRTALASIRSQGVKPVVFANLQVADTATEQFRNALRRYTLRGRWAEDLVLLGFGEGTVSARLGLTRSNMAVLSLSHPELRGLLADQMIDLVRDGAAALQLDKTVVVQYLDFNESVPTSPDRSAPQGLLLTLNEILERGRQIDPEFALASETWWDRTFQFVDVLYSRMVDIDIPDPALLFTFPEVASTIFAENPADFNVMNNGMRYGMVWALAPRHYHDSIDETLTRPLASYVRELIRIRSKHRGILFHGRFQDTLGAQVSRHPDLRYSVFRSAGADEPRQACVLVNYGNRPLETSVSWDAGSDRVEICQPYQPDRVTTLPAAIQLPPHTCAVAVELPGSEFGGNLSAREGDS
jgi:hypothetical protein